MLSAPRDVQVVAWMDKSCVDIAPIMYLQLFWDTKWCRISSIHGRISGFKDGLSERNP